LGLKAIRLTITPKLLLVIVLVAVLVVAVYAITVLFTQTVPSTTVKSPSSSPSATADCSTLTNSPNIITLSATGYTRGVENVTCSGGPAFAVTSEGLFTASISPTVVIRPDGFQLYEFRNYTAWQGSAVDRNGTPIPGGCEEPDGSPLPPGLVADTFSLPYDGSFVTLSKGDYIYCLGYSLGPYTTSSPTSLPSFTIAWSSG